MEDRFEFDVKLTVSELYAFSMRHTYFKISGLFGIVLSIAAWVYCFLYYETLDDMSRMILLIIGCLFTFVQPLMILVKVQAQIKKSEAIKDAIHYQVSEEGIEISQGEQQVVLEWQQIRKLVKTKKADYLYTSPVRAMIFPKEQCGEHFDAMTEFMEKQMKGKKL